MIVAVVSFVAGLGVVWGLLYATHTFIEYQQRRRAAGRVRVMRHGYVTRLPENWYITVGATEVYLNGNLAQDGLDYFQSIVDNTITWRIPVTVGDTIIVESLLFESTTYPTKVRHEEIVSE